MILHYELPTSYVGEPDGSDSYDLSDFTYEVQPSLKDYQEFFLSRTHEFDDNKKLFKHIIAFLWYYSYLNEPDLEEDDDFIGFMETKYEDDFFESLKE